MLCGGRTISAGCLHEGGKGCEGALWSGSPGPQQQCKLNSSFNLTRGRDPHPNRETGGSDLIRQIQNTSQSLESQALGWKAAVAAVEIIVKRKMLPGFLGGQDWN